MKPADVPAAELAAMPGTSAWAEAHRLERASRMAQRHPEAQADIAAARMSPGASGIAMEVEMEGEAALRDADAPVMTYRPGGDATPLEPEPDPAEPVEAKRTLCGCMSCDTLTWEIDNGKALILRGDALARYLALQTAAARASEATRAAQAAGVQLRDAFHQVCAGFSPASKEP